MLEINLRWVQCFLMSRGFLRARLEGEYCFYLFNLSLKGKSSLIWKNKKASSKISGQPAITFFLGFMAFKSFHRNIF